MEKNDDLYIGLIEEIRTNREEMGEMLKTATQFREQVNTILPSTTDFKRRYLVEEKMKLITSIFGVELDIRKQRETSLKTELELRRKISGEEDDRSKNAVYNDAIALAKAIEKYEGKKQPDFKEEIPQDTTE